MFSFVGLLLDFGGFGLLWLLCLCRFLLLRLLVCLLVMWFASYLLWITDGA